MIMSKYSNKPLKVSERIEAIMLIDDQIDKLYSDVDEIEEEIMRKRVRLTMTRQTLEVLVEERRRVIKSILIDERV